MRGPLYMVEVASGTTSDTKRYRFYIRAATPRDAFDAACVKVELRGEPTPNRGRARSVMAEDERARWVHFKDEGAEC